MIGDRVHHRIRTQRQLLIFLFEGPAQPGQAGVVAVAHRHHEVAADEDHDLAGLDDLPGQGHRLVRDVLHRLEHQEQGVVVALHLGALMGMDGILDGQRVQAEHLGDRFHLMLVRFVQTDPDEGLLPAGLQFVHPVQRGGVGVLARLPGAVDIDRAVHGGAGDRHVDAFGAGLLGGGAATVRTQQGRWQRPERRHGRDLPSPAGQALRGPTGNATRR